jgi:hypothetical protein
MLTLYVYLCLAWGFSERLPLTAADAPPAFPEYRLKAAFLYHLPDFVEWPTSAFAAPDSPFVLGILGEDPFGPELGNLIREKRVQGRPIQLRLLAEVRDAAGCHMLFISRSEQARLTEILEGLERLAILSVGDMESPGRDGGFAREGGMINLVVVKEQVRIELNLEEARAAGLEVSSKLWRLATLVKSKPRAKAR